MSTYFNTDETAKTLAVTKTIGKKQEVPPQPVSHSIKAISNHI